MMPVYTDREEFNLHGIRLPFVSRIITPPIANMLRKGWYEDSEYHALRDQIQAGDRVLEMGTGLGLISSLIARIPGIEAVAAVEANPALVEFARETHRLNGIRNVDLRHGAVTKSEGQEKDFFLRRDFWASSLDGDAEPYEKKISVPALGLAPLLNELKPNVLVADIEGGELDAFSGADLTGIRLIILEMHPHVYGEAGQAQLISYFERCGFHTVTDYTRGNVWVFKRH